MVMKPKIEKQISQDGNVELTEAEKRLLDISLAGRQRGQMFLLAAGIIFIAAGICVWAYSYFGIIPAGETSFKQLEAKISGVPVQTGNEATMKEMLLLSTKKMAKDRKAITQNRFKQAGFFLAFCGLVFIFIHFRDRIYQGLIRKLGASRVPET